MNWTTTDMDTYLQQHDYIDTLLVPLLKIDTHPERMKSSSSETEFLMHLTNFIETQFKGRMMLMPPFSYTQTTDFQSMAHTLSEDLNLMPFKHIFYLTTDSEWKSVEIAGEVIWLPALPLESMDKQLKQSIIEDQLRQVLPQLTKKWLES